MQILFLSNFNKEQNEKQLQTIFLTQSSEGSTNAWKNEIVK